MFVVMQLTLVCCCWEGNLFSYKSHNKNNEDDLKKKQFFNLYFKANNKFPTQAVYVKTFINYRTVILSEKTLQVFFRILALPLRSIDSEDNFTSRIHATICLQF